MVAQAHEKRAIATVQVRLAVCGLVDMCAVHPIEDKRGKQETNFVS